MSEGWLLTGSTNGLDRNIASQSAPHLTALGEADL